MSTDTMTDPSAGTALLTYGQAAQLLAVSPRTVWGLVDAGELRAVRIGRAVRIAADDLRAYIDRQRA